MAASIYLAVAFIVLFSEASCFVGATTTATGSSAAVAGGAYGPDGWRKWGGSRLNQGSASSTGDRILASQQATSLAVLKAAQGLGRTEAASQVGLRASRTVTDRSTALRAFDRIGGGRKMLQLSMNAAQDAVRQALNGDADSLRDGTRAATQKAMAFARMQMRRSTRPWEFSTNDP